MSAATVWQMKRLAALAVVSLALSCDKGGGTTPPPDASADVESTSAGSDAGASETEPGDEGEDAAPVNAADHVAAADSPDDPPTDGGDATDDPPAVSDGGEPDSPEDDPPQDTPAKLAKLELPKALHSKVDNKCGKDPGVGQKLKSFKLPRVEEGKTYSNGSFRGRVVLVNFWGTWCKPCLKELPQFAQLYRRYRKHGMTLLAIATDEDADAVKDTLAAKKIAAKVAIGGEAYAGKYESTQFPFSFVVDHRGVIQASYFGYEPECMGHLEAQLREGLEKRAQAQAK